jgi:hypothetical protein
MIESIDVKVFGAITVGTVVAVSALRKSFPKLAGKEPVLALLIPVIAVVACKFGGLLKGTEWIDAVLWAFGAGAGAGVAHDKVWNPVLSVLSVLFSKKDDDEKKGGNGGGESKPTPTPPVATNEVKP